MPWAPEVPSWADVLAEVEADVARSESMFSTASGSAVRDTREFAAAEMMFPGAGPLLPDPVTMPPVPAELAARIDALRSRITSLSDELKQALDAVGVLLVPADHGVAHRPIAVPTPRFVDRTL
ncbi:hypothetical protein [uncultured Jatrophihabitans sp.]|uniref:hypothetical protein n=1 Tax=uncultured Jatrophihabitans sp. TaxID=1610747 RepID=UPI0035CC9CD2